MEFNYKRVIAEANDCSNLENPKIARKIEELVNLMGKNDVLIIGYANLDKESSPGSVIFHGKYRLLPAIAEMINNELATEIINYKTKD